MNIGFQDEVLVSKHCSQLPYLWSTQQLSFVPLSGVAALTLISFAPNCECGASEQTADHVLTACPIHRAPHGARRLTILDDETRC